MKLAIMQPYFMPYIGYFQLLNVVDQFVMYDNIQFSKKGWIQRNRILMNGTDYMFSLPMKKSSDYSHVCERNLAATFPTERIRILRRIESAYRKSLCFESVMPLVERCMMHEDDNLFRFIHHSVQQVCEYLGIVTPIVISSSLKFDPCLKGQDKVLAICQELSASHYINAINGRDLYSKDTFAEKQIQLSFIESQPIAYSQYQSTFIPNLSIIDVMMFNSVSRIQEYLSSYNLV